MYIYIYICIYVYTYIVTYVYIRNQSKQAIILSYQGIIAAFVQKKSKKTSGSNKDLQRHLIMSEFPFLHNLAFSLTFSCIVFPFQPFSLCFSLCLFRD